MRSAWLVALALPLMAAAPQSRQLSLAVPADDSLSFSGGQTAPRFIPRSTFAPAPLPNRDLNTPGPARASSEPTLAPTLFTTRTQFRGDGFSPGSTAQGEQEHKVRPGAGFSLHMPFTPQ